MTTLENVQLDAMQTTEASNGNRLINDLCLPYPIYKAMANDPYTNGGADYSVSQLFEGPKYIFGNRAIPKGFREKTSDKLALFDGSMTHDGLEHRLINDDEFIVEKRMFLNIIINDRPIKISGAFDVYCKTDFTLYDYKTTALGGWRMRHKKMPAYSQQVNIYRLMMKMNKIAEPTRLKIIFIVKGWNKIDSFSANYPPTQYPEEIVELVPYEEVVQLLRTKINMLEHYKNMPLEEMPYCEPHQRWEDPPTYKVCKYDANGQMPLRPRAVAHGVFNTEEEAKALQQKKGSGYFYTEVGGIPKRCLEYCKVAKAGLCDFGQKFNAEKYQKDNESDLPLI